MMRALFERYVSNYEDAVVEIFWNDCDVITENEKSGIFESRSLDHTLYSIRRMVTASFLLSCSSSKKTLADLSKATGSTVWVLDDFMHRSTQLTAS